jgi:hypothetical protein
MSDLADVEPAAGTRTSGLARLGKGISVERINRGA